MLIQNFDGCAARIASYNMAFHDPVDPRGAPESHGPLGDEVNVTPYRENLVRLEEKTLTAYVTNHALPAGHRLAFATNREMDFKLNRVTLALAAFERMWHVREARLGHIQPGWGHAFEQIKVRSHA